MHGLRVQSLPEPIDLLSLQALHPGRYPFLLESTSGQGAATSLQGRYDILFAFPDASLILGVDGQLSATGFEPNGNDFLANLDHWYGQLSQDHTDDLPFHGGWFLYLGYELAEQVEPTLKLQPGPIDLPIALAVRCPAAVIHDRASGQSVLIAEAEQENCLEQMTADIANLPERIMTSAVINVRLDEEPPEKFLRAFDRIQEYIRAGDVFQVNLSRRWQIELKQTVTTVDLYDRLRHANPAPFSGLMHWMGTSVLSSSPERLVRSHSDGRIETRPIAGTHPRLDDQAADRLQSQALLEHPKERAEHVMLLDLERNDLGRVCESGTVKVNEFMNLETYSHVHHIVSNVWGKRRTGVGPGTVIRAVFPGGTITGCPKVRCMQIISELEGEGRGAYTGSMGFLDRSGALDLNILIRSLILRERSGWLRTGAGIVTDSNRQNELEETRAKALGLIRLFEVV